MKKIMIAAGLAAMMGVSVTADAWWGPYGYPYWGGYAPVLVPPPAVALSPEQLAAQRQAVEQWGDWPGAAGPWGSDNDPWGANDFNDQFAKSTAERARAQELMRAKRAMFREYVQARRAFQQAHRPFAAPAAPAAATPVEEKAPAAPAAKAP